MRSAVYSTAGRASDLNPEPDTSLELGPGLIEGGQVSPIRRIFGDAFARAGLAYFNPHSFRKTLVLLGQQICDTAEKLKAWSQNLGHEDVLTTFSSYGHIPSSRQAEIITNLSRPNEVDMDMDAALKTLERS